MIASTLSTLHRYANAVLLRAWCASPLQWLKRRGTIRSKPKGPVLQNTFGQAVAAPTDKRGFVMLKFLELVRLHWPRMVMGGVGLPVSMAARLRTCFSHPAHPMR